MAQVTITTHCFSFLQGSVKGKTTQRHTVMPFGASKIELGFFHVAKQSSQTSCVFEEKRSWKLERLLSISHQDLRKKIVVKLRQKTQSQMNRSFPAAGMDRKLHAVWALFKHVKHVNRSSRLPPTESVPNEHREIISQLNYSNE